MGSIKRSDALTGPVPSPFGWCLNEENFWLALLSTAQEGNLALKIIGSFLPQGKVAAMEMCFEEYQHQYAWKGTSSACSNLFVFSFMCSISHTIIILIFYCDV
jgi:hypothetical protein